MASGWDDDDDPQPDPWWGPDDEVEGYAPDENWATVPMVSLCDECGAEKIRCDSPTGGWYLACPTCPPAEPETPKP